jgi:hypothetical protein
MSAIGEVRRTFDLEDFSHRLRVRANQPNSDILAEMPLPQSGISRHETMMNGHMPSGIHYSDEAWHYGLYQTDENVTALELKYYWSQIQLRITLNSVHNILYGENRPSEYLPVRDGSCVVRALCSGDTLTFSSPSAPGATHLDGESGCMAGNDNAPQPRNGLG